MGLTRQAVQRIVDLLAERGMVAFEDNPHHRRAKLVVLTRAGLAAVTSAEQAVATLDREIAERIGRDRIEDATRILGEMNVILTEWLDRTAPFPSPNDAS